LSRDSRLHPCQNSPRPSLVSFSSTSQSADGRPITHLPYLLPSSVSRNPLVCDSYEKCRGVYQQFPFWTSPFVVCALNVSALDFYSAFSFATLHKSRITGHESLSLFPATHPKKPPITRLLATLPKLLDLKSFVCHTCNTPPGGTSTIPPMSGTLDFRSFRHLEEFLQSAVALRQAYRAPWG